MIATHWHDDHIRGLGKTFKACDSAEFVCSSALKSDEFLTLVDAYSTHSMIEGTGIQEMWEIIKELLVRKMSGASYFALHWAIADRPLWKKSAENTTLTIYALSPSDAAVLAAKLDIGRLFPSDRETQRALLATSPNRSAVVIWANIGDYNILLGADLEEVGDSCSGWTGILNSSLRPSGRAFYFKIPHHGSITAHHPTVWSDMLHSNPVATLTPYVNGSTRLPTNTDISRISSLTNKVFTTTPPERTVTIKKRSGIVDKTIKETVLSIKRLYPSIGHVRMRVKPDGEERIELFGSAYRLN